MMNKTDIIREAVAASKIIRDKAMIGKRSAKGNKALRDVFKLGRELGYSMEADDEVINGIDVPKMIWIDLLGIDVKVYLAKREVA